MLTAFIRQCLIGDPGAVRATSVGLGGAFLWFFLTSAAQASGNQTAVILEDGVVGHKSPFESRMHKMWTLNTGDTVTIEGVQEKEAETEGPPRQVFRATVGRKTGWIDGLSLFIFRDQASFLDFASGVVSATQLSQNQHADVGSEDEQKLEQLDAADFYWRESSNPSEEVRAHAARRAFRNISDEPTLAQLWRKFQTDKALAVRLAADQALINEQDTRAIIQNTGLAIDLTRRVKRAAGRELDLLVLLIDRGDHPDRNALILAAAQKGSLTAVRTLSRLSTPEADCLLVRDLNSPDASLREAASETLLGVLNQTMHDGIADAPSGSTALLLSAYHHGDPEFKRSIVGRFTMEGEASRPLFLEIVNDADPETFSAYTQRLDQMLRQYEGSSQHGPFSKLPSQVLESVWLAEALKGVDSEQRRETLEDYVQQFQALGR